VGFGLFVVWRGGVEDARTGSAFFNTTVKPMLEKFRPDLLFIDPALAYLGGESNSQADVTWFLRNQLNPLLREYDCGAIVLHHTAKPPRQSNGSSWTHADYAYSGSGSAEWANWPRAILVIRGTENPSVFELKATKRGGRIRWKDNNGLVTTTRHIAHSKEEGQLYWREPDPSEIPAGAAGKSGETDQLLIMDIVPADDTIEKGELIAECKSNGVSERGAAAAIKKLIAAGKLYIHEIARSGIRPAIHLSQTPPRADAGKKE
jgi:hypothetical protein